MSEASETSTRFLVAVFGADFWCIIGIADFLAVWCGALRCIKGSLRDNGQHAYSCFEIYTRVR